MIKYYSFIITLVFSLLSCNSQNYFDWQVVQFSGSLPLVSTKGEVNDVKDSAKIIYYKDFIVFEIPVVEMPSLVHWDSTGKEIEIPLKEKVLKEYFVYRKGDSVGFRYKSLNEEPFKEQIVDTFLKYTVFGNLHIDELHGSLNYRLIETVHLDEYRTMEKYTPIFKANSDYPDTNYLFFDSRLNNLKYSISPILDSIKQKKLYKLELRFNVHYDSNYKTNVAQQSLLMEIKPATVNNKDALVNFLKNFADFRGSIQGCRKKQ